MPVAVTVSDWREAPALDSAGEALFAIGDVHGQTAHLAALREAIGRAAGETRLPTRLVQVGDLVDGGKDSAGTLDLVAASGWGDGFRNSHLLLGNHEILMRLCLEAENSAALAMMWRAWTGNGGAATLASFGLDGDGDGDETQPAFRETFAARCGDLLQRMESHVALGSIVVVHAGIDPRDDADGLARFLAKPWSELPRPEPGGDRHWAWIREVMLHWQGPAKSGRIAVHGHTPETKVERVMRGRYPGAHVFDGLRLGLDGGSWRSGRIGAVQIESGRYRVFVAEGPPV